VVRGEGGEVFVIRRCGGIGGPVLEEHVPSPGTQRLVGSSHEVRWGDVSPGWGRGV